MNPFRLPSLHRQSAQSGGELDVSERSELGHHFCQRRIFIWVIVQVKCLLSGFTRDRNIGPKQDIHFRSLIYGPCAARRCIMAPVQTFGKAANGTGWQRQLQLTLKVANWQWMGRKGAKKGEGSWSAHRAGPLAAGVRSRRRSREAAGRVRSVRFGLTEEEFDEVGAAAAEAGLAKGAYAAQATLVPCSTGIEACAARHREGSSGEGWEPVRLSPSGIISDDLVFTTAVGTNRDPRNFNRSFNSRCEKAGVRRIRVLSRPGARFRDCSRPVSPDRSPNPPCQSPGNGLCPVPAVTRGSQGAMGMGSCYPGRRSGRPSRFRAGSTRPRPRSPTAPWR